MVLLMSFQKRTNAIPSPNQIREIANLIRRRYGQGMVKLCHSVARDVDFLSQNFLLLSGLKGLRQELKVFSC